MAASSSLPPVVIELERGAYSGSEIINGIVKLRDIIAVDTVRVEIVGRTQIRNGKELAHEHEIVRVGSHAWSRALDDVDDSSIPFALELPKIALPASLKLRSRKPDRSVKIEYAIHATVSTARHRYRAVCPFVYSPSTSGLPELSLTPSRLNPPLLDSRWSIASEEIKISRGLVSISSATTELKIAVPKQDSFAVNSTIPVVLSIAARSARHKSSAAPDLAVPSPGDGIKIILSQSHASPGQPVTTRDICDLFDIKAARVFDTGITYRGSGSKGRHERSLIAVSKFSYDSAPTFEGPQDRITVPTLPDSSRPVIITLPIAFHSSGRTPQIKSQPSTYIGRDSLKKEPPAVKDPLSLSRITSSSSAVSGYSDKLSVAL